jgi:glyoxylase-like metal-dependent hydrolase (beta-lactamase superfamily II)
MPEIQIITLPLPFGLGTVNCYLLETEKGHILIDTGAAQSRKALENELQRAGCRPGGIQLIVLTHGDFDHTGNAAYLREKLGAPIAMHRDDAGMAERGDLFWNRSSGNALLRWLSPLLFRFRKANRFTPDLWLEEGDHLGEYGLDAHVLSIPGHSKGSIGVLTAGGDLICGDLLENRKEPAINSIVDDPAACENSLERLHRLGISTVYPGHGPPLAMDSLKFPKATRLQGAVGPDGRSCGVLTTVRLWRDT